MSNTQLAVSMAQLGLSVETLNQLTQDMTAGLESYTKPQRVVMGNSGDFSLITSQGEQISLGREINFVIVAQRPAVSRIHYAQAYDPSNTENIFPDCYSTDGVAPDEGSTVKYSDTCANCPVKDRQDVPNCSYYRRLIIKLVNPDGTFSEPCILEPKAISLFDTNVQVNNGVTMMNYGAYMRALASNVVNGKKMPIPVQVLVTRCVPMNNMNVATMKFGVAPNEHGGVYLLDNERVSEILSLTNSQEIQELLRPFHPASENPSRQGQIPVKNVDAPQNLQIDISQTGALPAPTPKPAPQPSKKVPPKPVPAPKPKVNKVVLGIEHACVKNSSDYDYASIVEWANEATPDEVTQWLEENFPEALIPVELPAPTPKPAPQPSKKAPPKPVPVAKQGDPVVQSLAPEGNNNTNTISEADIESANKLAEELDALDFS